MICSFLSDKVINELCGIVSVHDEHESLEVGVKLLLDVVSKGSHKSVIQKAKDTLLTSLLEILHEVSADPRTMAIYRSLR